MAMRIYVVRPGDRLEDVALRFIDNPGDLRAMEKAIFNHNRHLIRNPNQLDIGARLAIPHLAKRGGW